MFGLGGDDDKYQDRSWDWAKKISRDVHGGWKNIFNQSLNAADGGMSPWGQNTFDYASQGLDSYTNYNGDFRNTDLWRTAGDLFSPWAEDQDPTQTSTYKGASDLWDITTKPLYQDLMPQLKRGIESQYGNAMESALSSGVRGGSLMDALSNAAMGRDTALGEMEMGLRAQDTARLDANQKARAGALTDLLDSLNRTYEAGRMNRSNMLSNLGYQMDESKSRQGLMAQMSLNSLLDQLTQGDIDRATKMGNLGIQGRMGVGQQLASNESQSNASLTSDLFGMGSMIWLGLGGSGLFGGASSIGGMTGGATGSGTMQSLFDLGVF
jgi:hypothetical protein